MIKLDKGGKKLNMIVTKTKLYLVPRQSFKRTFCPLHAADYVTLSIPTLVLLFLYLQKYQKNLIAHWKNLQF